MLTGQILIFCLSPKFLVSSSVVLKKRVRRHSVSNDLLKLILNSEKIVSGAFGNYRPGLVKRVMPPKLAIAVLQDPFFQKNVCQSSVSHGPARELCDLFFFWLGAAWVKFRAERPSVSGVNRQLHICVPIGPVAGLEHVHSTWAGTFVLSALVFLFPGVHFVLLDSDCVSVTLF